ncbi:MAG: hypothetical protein H0W21_09135 [Actinobacteria bacterium]|nr:hypothetical protein [Actinomycetota bacterium]
MNSRGRLIALVVVGGIGLLGGVLTGMVRRAEPAPVTRIELRAEPTTEPADPSRVGVVGRQGGPATGVRGSDADEDDISEPRADSGDDEGDDDSGDEGGDDVEGREDNSPGARGSDADEDDISEGDDSSVGEGDDSGDDSGEYEGDDSSDEGDDD